ncbi:hypothetical protein EMIT0P201_11672 [Pseudomonas chlororaphis]
MLLSGVASVLLPAWWPEPVGKHRRDYARSVVEGCLQAETEAHSEAASGHKRTSG